MKKAGYEKVPVISLNISGLEKNSGFHITLPMIRRVVAAVVYGDELMLLRNQCKPYEIIAGESDRLVSRWSQQLAKELNSGERLQR